MVQLAESQRAFSEDRTTPERITPRFSPPRERPSSSRLSPFVGSYSNCNSIDELCDRFTRYHRQVRDMVNTIGNLQIDDETRTMINLQKGLKAPLQFHSIHGSNIAILKNGKLAKRNESFCKGLAFSSRPIAVNEIVCLLLAEVNTSWSGVLRFGVTNENPTIYGDIPVPPFACPDLTTKEGHWAKALPERYSTEGNILHFYVNHSGELFYGINGSQKGMFLTGINVNQPMWLLLDIYGNSVAVEFIDSSEFRPRRNAPPPPAVPAPPRPTSVVSVAPTTSTLTESRTDDSERRPMRFHTVSGRNITFNTPRTVATRDTTEYYHGYVFTERPIENNEKMVIKICEVQPLYTGGLAFGVTCCNPANIRPSMLPDDSADLVENPEYWVTIKDLVPQARIGSLLSFWITDTGEVKFEIDNLGSRTVLHVDNSLELYMYWDLFGTTSSIRSMSCQKITRPRSPAVLENREITEQPLSIPRRPARISDVATSQSALNSSRVPPRVPSSPLRVNVRDYTTIPVPSIDDLLEGHLVPIPPPVAPRASTVIAPTRQSGIAISSPPDFSPPPLPQISSLSASGTGNIDNETKDECSICMDARVNSVLYTCGHMCMCDSCARQLLQTKGTCPICRAVVKDVVKIFRA